MFIVELKSHSRVFLSLRLLLILFWFIGSVALCFAYSIIESRPESAHIFKLFTHLDRVIEGAIEHV